MPHGREKVYNVEHVDFIIELNDEDVSEFDPEIQERFDGGELTIEGISDSGFGVTPTAETEMIEGLKGYEGFSVDPGNGAEIDLAVKSTSLSLPVLQAIYNKQQDEVIAPFKVRIEVNQSDIRPAFGFNNIEVKHCLLVNMAPFEVDGPEAPDWEFEMVGYGFTIENYDISLYTADE